ncbi:hypothetical protein B566_EDAN003676 [Ephemera danica]|nr:hypothetical protein B566_EDAN003676 [Ephemera danica]
MSNFLVILVVQCDRQVESKTNFLLGQLALADLCVGVFCVMQSFMAYLSNWLLGLFLCQMYLYVQALSYVASVLIMVAVCVERYVAIMQPFHTRSVFTSVRLRLIVIVVWVVSAAYAAPRLFFARVTSQALRHSTERDTFCHLDTRRYDPDAFDTANLVLLYAIPLLAMAAMYSRMCVELWRSGRRVPAGAVHAGRTLTACTSNNLPAAVEVGPDESPPGNTTTSLLHLVSEGSEAPPQLPRNADDANSYQSVTSVQSPTPPLRRIASMPTQPRRIKDSGARTCTTSPHLNKDERRSEHRVSCRERQPTCPCCTVTQPPPTPTFPRLVSFHPEAVNSTSSSRRRVEAEQPGPLAARRRVVLMLMLVVLSFLLCNLPYHARKMWQARLRSQPHLNTPSTSIYSKLFTPATFLVMYLNSALNPVLYVTMSRSFRRAMARRLCLCSRGITRPIRACFSCCLPARKPMPSPLIGRNSGSLRQVGFPARASSVVLGGKSHENGPTYAATGV